MEFIRKHNRDNALDGISQSNALSRTLDAPRAEVHYKFTADFTVFL